MMVMCMLVSHGLVTHTMVKCSGKIHDGKMMISCLLQVYFYDTKVKVVDTTAQDKRKKEEPNYFAGIKKMENKQDVGITPFTLANSVARRHLILLFCFDDYYLCCK